MEMLEVAAVGDESATIERKRETGDGRAMALQDCDLVPCVGFPAFGRQRPLGRDRLRGHHRIAVVAGAAGTDAWDRAERR